MQTVDTTHAARGNASSCTMPCTTSVVQSAKTARNLVAVTVCSVCRPGDDAERRKRAARAQ